MTDDEAELRDGETPAAYFERLAALEHLPAYVLVVVDGHPGVLTAGIDVSGPHRLFTRHPDPRARAFVAIDVVRRVRDLVGETSAVLLDEWDELSVLENLARDDVDEPEDDGGRPS